MISFNLKVNPGNRTLAPMVLVLLCMACICPGALAGEMHQAQVRYQDGRYLLDFAGVIDGRYDVVHGLVSDYAGLHRLSDAVLESEVLGSPHPGTQRVRFVGSVCILIFCFTKTLVVDVREHPEGVYHAAVVPALCDFRAGHGTWRFAAAGSGRTTVHYTGVQQPAFWIPPVIGPYILRHKLVQEAINAIKNLEQLARHA